MPLKILLADDSMTAQNLGKKILTDAGYDVTAVSNGAAAAKKLAEKFDVIILDIYMPGYSGLEICEKVRATMDIAKTPVLLTVGKMEPYKPEDGAKVKADGVIIKPFEASDLLAVVQKLEQKMKAAAAVEPDYEKTMIFKAPQIEEFKDESYAEWKDSPDHQEAPPPAPMEMSMEMGSAPAFSDMMESAPAAFEETVNIPPPAATGFDMAPPAMQAFEETNIPPPAAAADDFAFSAPPSSMDAAPAGAPAFGFDMPSEPAITPVESKQYESLLEQTAATPVGDIPVAAAPEVEFTAAQVGHVEHVIDPTLETSDESGGAYDIASQDPSLVTDPTQLATEFVTKFVDHDEPVEVPGISAAPPVAAEASVEEEVARLMSGASATPAPEDDFEARVAAAMSEGYEADAAVESDEPAAQAAPIEMAVEEPAPIEMVADITEPDDTQKIAAPVGSVDARVMLEPEPEAQDPAQDQMLVQQMQEAFANVPAEEHAPEPEPMVMEAAFAAVPETSAPAPAQGPDMELANALAAAVGGDAPSSSNAVLAAAASASPGTDQSVMASAISRVMERMLPGIIVEVVKEIESNKK